MLRSSGRTVADVSRELGVSEPTLRRWRLQAGDERGEGSGPTLDEPSRRAPERESRPLSEDGEGPRRGDRPLPLPAHPPSPMTHEGGVRRRRFTVSHPGRPARVLARLTADAIEVGIAVVTAPAKWAASGLRWYAGRTDEVPGRAFEGKDAEGPSAE